MLFFYFYMAEQDLLIFSPKYLRVLFMMMLLNPINIVDSLNNQV